MCMSRKNYIAIAEVIKTQRSLGPLRTAEDMACNSSVQSVLDLVAMNMADYLQQDNQRFDRARFLTACGMV
jgi:hypothetical protein